MKILKLALLTTLRIAFFGSLKLALLAYTLFLTVADSTDVAPEDAVNLGGPTSDTGPLGLKQAVHTSETVLASTSLTS